MSTTEIILRKWSGRIRTADEQEYVGYVARTGADDYTATPGNLGHQILVRTLGDGTSEVTTLSWWRDMEAIHGFAGPQPELSRYYPADDRFLLDRSKFVEHHRVLGGEVRIANSE